ncbi:MAG: bifunctional adenosylcobinamide kinase/adenosylcobinamide-phosphate guanylyltransferase [Thermodesulfovibrionales bacterium]
MIHSRGSKVFVLGGARSGKSGFALRAASALAGRKVYLATAQAYDGEMRERIRRHREERTAEWDTIEEPVNLADLLAEIGDRYDVILVDCLTLWLSNLMLGSHDADAEIERLLLVFQETPAAVFVVSNEVGLGIVPENELARAFRDRAGTLNQKIAAASDQVYFVAAGIAMKMKG